MMEVILFVATNMEQEVFAGERHLEMFAAFIRSRVAELANNPSDDSVIDSFGNDHQHEGSFYEFDISDTSVPHTYLLTEEEGRDRFRELIGRPPTDAEFVELKRNFPDNVHESGFWDTLDLTIKDIAGV